MASFVVGTLYFRWHNFVGMAARRALAECIWWAQLGLVGRAVLCGAEGKCRMGMNGIRRVAMGWYMV